MSMTRYQRITRVASRALIGVLAIGLVLGLVPAATAAREDATIEPALAAAIALNPKKTYRVIVQAEPSKRDSDRSADRERVGKEIEKDDAGDRGRVRHTLGLINGFAADLTGKRILKLAKTTGVKAISGDHLVKMSADTGTLAISITDTTSTVAVKSMQTLVAQAPSTWSQFGSAGQGVTVAVLDSGIAPNPELDAAFGIDLTTGGTSLSDAGGHGTHVAGIIGGSGSQLGGKYKGASPSARVLSVKVTSDTGAATYSSIIKGLQWVVANRKIQNIRVVNLSVGATASTSYKNDPLAAAVEMTWFSGVVVVASAGNSGSAAGTITVPGNDPFIITVGASNQKNTVDLIDDVIPSWSSRGPTAYDSLQKPDVVAGGNRVISLRSPGSYIETVLGIGRIVDQYYLRLSGTSMAAPVVSGVAAMILSANPSLSPNQVKSIILSTAKPYTNIGVNTQGAGSVDGLAAVQLARSGAAIAPANRGAVPSSVFARSIYTLAYGAPLIWRDSAYQSGAWDSASWDSLLWNSAAWENLCWECINWSSAAWTSVSWESLTGWASGSWGSGSWDSGSWDSGSWDSGSWDSGAWDSGQWDSALLSDEE